MGLLDRLLGRTPELAVPAPRNLAGRSIGFAAQRIDPGVRPDRRSLAKRATNEKECWAAYKAVGEIGYVVDLFGNALRRIRVLPAGIDDPEAGRQPLADVAWSTPSLVDAAVAELERVRSVEHGQGEVLAQMAINLKVAGAGNLYGRFDPDTGDEDWEVVSTSALDVKRDQWIVRRYPADRDGVVVGADDFLWRFWQRDPEWPGLAYSEMRRVLGHASGLQILEQAFRARGRSRIAGNGVWLMSSRVAFTPKGGPGKGDDFFEDLLTGMTAPMFEEGAASSFAPMLVDVDTDDVSKVSQHVTFDRPLTEIEEKREDKLLRRIAQGLDAPPELVTGMADLNHWTAWQVEESTYEAHVEPLALRVADILAVAVLRPALLAAGFAPELVARVQVGVDPSDLIRRPNRGEEVNDGHDRLVLSDDTWRREKGYTEEDAPPMDELLRRMALKRGITTEMLTAELLANYAGADVARTIAKGEAATAESEAKAIDTTATESSSSDAGAEEGPPVLPAVAAAASTSSVGRRLLAVDVDLMARLEGASSAAVERALERAQSRATRAARGKRLKTSGGGRGLLARLDQEQRTTLAVGDEDLVTDADFDQLAADWERWVPDAWTAAVGVAGVDVDEPRDDFDAGWLLLLAALVGVARAALHTADAVPVGDEDPGSVQVGHVRRALARAGGALGVETDGGAVLVDAGTRPAGMVATGENILTAAAQAGLVLTGWTWRVGFPVQPFPPHHALADVAFSSWTDARLANESGQWPGVAFWHPGDHSKCRCSSEPRLEPAGEN